MSNEAKQNQYQKLLNDAHSILSHDDKEWPCKIIDISLHGCLLCFNNTWEQQNIEAIYTLTLQTPTSEPVIMNLSMSHAIDNEVSFKCEHIDISHNVRLHQLVGNDPDACMLLEREILELTHSE